MSDIFEHGYLKIKPEPTLRVTDDNAYWILDNIMDDCEEVYINKHGHVVPKFRVSEIDSALFIVGFMRCGKNKIIMKFNRGV